MASDPPYRHPVPEQVCPKCGSKEVIEVGVQRLMCQECYHVFDNETYLDKSSEQQKRELCPICGKPTRGNPTQRCPYCMRSGICAEHFWSGICSECTEQFKLATRLSEEAAAELAENPDEDRPYRHFILFEFLKELGENRNNTAEEIYEKYLKRLKDIRENDLINDESYTDLLGEMDQIMESPTLKDAERIITSTPQNTTGLVALFVFIAFLFAAAIIALVLIL